MAVLTAGGVALPEAAHADNTTVSGDALRTGWDQGEPALAPAQVTASDFGQQFSTAVDGSVYAQPLVVGGTAVVTTEKAKVYGIDAATGAVTWTRSFGSPFQSSTIGCGDLTPDLGSTSTPVYDPASDTVYLTTKIADGATAQAPHWYLQAISPHDGTSRPGFPVVLQGTADNDPAVTFSPYLQMQRAGLLLAGGKVYVGFGSHCDIGAWRGWVMAVSVTGAPGIASTWTTEVSNGGGAGVWGAGGGLVSDGSDPAGNPRVFLATGNGLSPPAGPGSAPPGYLGDAVVRIGLDGTGHLAAKDFFAPANAPTLDQGDADLGSGAPAALPDSFGTPSHPHLLVEDGKDGRVFLLDRDSLGGRSQGTGGTDAVLQTLGPFSGVWGHPAVYGGEGGYVYYVGNSGPLRALARTVTSGGSPALAAVGASADTSFGYTSGSPVVTSSGTTAGSALVWVVYSTGATGAGGQLRAYGAVPQNGTLPLEWSAPIGTASKFEMPATSGGRVYVGTRDGHLLAFGRPASVALTGQPVDVGQVPVGATGSATAHLTASRAVTVTGASTTAPFATSTAGLPRTLAAGGTLDVPVSFTPTAPGAATAALVLTTDVGTVTLDLHGYASQAGLSAAPSALAFGTVATSQTRSLTAIVSNTGTVDERISAVTAPAAPFGATGLPPVGTVVPAQQSVSVSVTYAPTAAAASSGSLSLTSTSGVLTLPLSGTGQTGQGHLALTPAGTDFGSVVVGTSRTLGFDIGNTGNIPVTVTLAKAPSGVFTAATPLSEGITIGPGDVVHQQVTFTPTVAGPAAAQYQLNADDGQSAQAEALTGTGVTGSALPPPTGAAWTRNGAVTVSGGDVVLTPAQPNLAGSAVSNTTVASNGLDASFTAQIGGGTGADGMTFTLLDGGAPATSLGGTGGALGYGGLAGAVAVTLDTYQNPGEPSANFVGVATGTGATPDALTYVATSTNIGRLTAGTHAVDVNVYGGRLRVTVDATLVIDTPVTLPATVRPAFTAGTGGQTDQHAVRGVSITSPAGTVPGAPPVAVDRTVSVDGRGTLTTAAFSTTSAKETLLALVGYDGAASSKQTASVTGAGLTWTLARRTDTQAGDAEVWSASAPAALASVTVTATPAGGYDGSLTVVALRNAKGVGASASASAASGAPAVAVTTTAPGSWVFAAGNDWDNAVARTPDTGQTLLHTDVDTGAGDTFWAQSTAAPTPAAGTVRVADTAPTADRWNLAGVEVLALPAAGGDTTPPTVGLTAPAAGATVAGSTSLTASASDDQGVASVQFLVDGVAVGAPVTAAPYARTWDTTTAANGSHTVTARATDTSGNTTVSAPVTVTVANAAPDSTPPTVTLTAPAAAASVSRTVTVTAGASDNVGVARVQLLLDGAPLGAALTSAPYQLAWDSTTAGNGSHTLSAKAYDAAGNIGTAPGVAVAVANAAPSGLGTDATVSRDGRGTVTTAGVTAATAGDLLLATVSADGPTGGGQAATVSGGGLAWTLVKRATTSLGTAEVWQARATGTLSGLTVTSALAAPGYDQSLTVLALRGAAGVGASGGASAATGAPSVGLTTTAAGSWLVGAGSDWDRATARTPATGQSLVHQWLDTGAGDTFWAQSSTPAAAVGTAVTLRDTAPTSDRWNLVAVEVRPSP